MGKRVTSGARCGVIAIFLLNAKRDCGSSSILYSFVSQYCSTMRVSCVLWGLGASLCFHVDEHMSYTVSDVYRTDSCLVVFCALSGGSFFAWRGLVSFFALGILIGVRLIIVIAWHASSSLWAPRRTRWRNILGLRGDMT